MNQFVMRESVLIVDDDDFTRMTLTSVIGSLGYEVAGRVGSVAEAMDLTRRTEVDLAIVDLDLGEGPTGIDLAHGLRGIRPSIDLVILSSYADPRFLGRRSRGMPPRAVFLTKQELGDIEVLRRALLLAQDESDDVPANGVSNISPHSGLSETQIEVMRLIAAGFSNAEIARRMWITEAGVNRAVTRLVKQLGLDVTKDRNPRVLVARAYAELAGRSMAHE